MVGRVLCYARPVYLTVTVSLIDITSEQSTATEKIESKVNQLLDYIATNLSEVIQFHACDMILNIHLDASYIFETRPRSRVSGHSVLVSKPIKVKPINVNRDIYVFCLIFKFFVASAAEAELGALFINAKEGKNIRIFLQELGHKQLPTPIHCDNVTQAGI